MNGIERKLLVQSERSLLAIIPVHATKSRLLLSKVKGELVEVESLVMLDTERKEELVMAKNLRACSTPFRPQVFCPPRLEGLLSAH